MNDLRNMLLTVSILVAALALPSSGEAGPDPSDRIVTVNGTTDPLTLQAERRALLVGTWYGSQSTPDGGTHAWIARHLVNGTIRIDFKMYGKIGTASCQSEVGRWGVSGPVLVSVIVALIVDGQFVPVDPQDPGGYNAYRIIDLTEDTLEYEHYAYLQHYSAKKVTDDFDFPDGTPACGPPATPT